MSEVKSILIKFKHNLWKVLRKPLDTSRHNKEQIIENLAVLISSGLDIRSSILALIDENKDSFIREKLVELEAATRQGASLWQTLAKQDILPDYMLSLLRVGEETGKLQQNLGIVSKQLQQNREYRSKIFSALAYPLLILISALVIGIGLFWFIIPRITQVYGALKLDLPPLTKVLIEIGAFMEQHGSVVVPTLLLVLVLCYYVLFINKRSNYLGQALLFWVKPVRSIINTVEVARFGFVLGSLLDTGLPIWDAFYSLAQSSSWHRYRNLYTYLEQRISAGESFKQALDGYKYTRSLMPSSVVQVIAAAERSGNLKKALLQTAEVYDQRIDVASKNFAVLLEPVMLIVVWVFVMIIALGVILPIYSLIGGVRAGAISSAVPVETSPTPIPENSITYKLEIVDNGQPYLNIRSVPSPAGEIIARAIPGEVYSYVSREGDWYKILLLGDQYGWIFADQVVEIANET